MLRKTQIHFFSLLPELPKRPKQKNSCSKMFPIDQLYIELGLNLVQMKHTFLQWGYLHILVPISCPPDHCHVYFWISRFFVQVGNGNIVFHQFHLRHICHSWLKFKIVLIKKVGRKTYYLPNFSKSLDSSGTLPQNINVSSSFCKGPRTSKVWKTKNLKGPRT